MLLMAMAIDSGAQRRAPAIGIAGSYKDDSTLHAAGYNCLVESVQNLFSPRKFTNAQFEANVGMIKQLQTPIYAVNIFVPSELKLVGPSMNEDTVLAYAQVVFHRMQLSGIHMLVWGSGGARRVPDGFSQSTAREQFVSLARKVSKLGQRYGIRIVLENLNHTETNFINTLADAIDIARRVNEPNFGVCVDIYHMLKEGEPASVIVKGRKYLVHCDIAERDKRTPPGTAGDDFRPYLSALKKAKFKGKIILECRWENVRAQAAPALKALQRQLADVYGF